VKVLNLYSGIGGNRKMWEGVDVTAVEFDPKIAKIYSGFFPKDKIIVGDAHQYLIENYDKFDFIWSSPPCQTHTKMINSGRNRKPIYQDFKLYEEIFFLKKYHKGKYVVENVEPFYKPLISPNRRIGRHLFWTDLDFNEDVEVKNFPNFIKTGTVAGSEEMKKWLGLEYEGNIYYKGNHDPCQVLRNCVKPEIGKHILNSLKGV